MPAKTPPDALLIDLDKSWDGPGGARIRLRILGSMALMLQTDYVRGTKDGDILEADPVSGSIKQRLLDLGGPGTDLARRHAVYIDVVSSGILLLPARPEYVPLPDISSKLTHFEVEALSVLDVVISKLKPFRSTDIVDIDAMISRRLFTHEEFLLRFQSAVDRFADSALGQGRLRTIVDHFNQVERDSFGVDESEIALPPWVDE